MIQLIISGLSMGIIYALVACGFSLIFRMTRVLNFASGDLVMAGGMIGYSLYVLVGLPFWLALPGSMLAIAILMLVIERLALAPVYRQGILAGVVVTIGLSFVLQNSAQIIWGRGGFSFPSVFGNEAVEVAGMRVVPELAAIFLIGAVAVALLGWFLTRTKIGLAARATAADRETALLMGIDTRGMNLISFFVSGALSGLAGVLLAPVTFLTATIGLPLGLMGFVAALVGGLGSMPGAVAGGLILGVVELVVAAHIDANYRESIAFVVMIAILLVRPYGIFGEEGTEEER
ncbi:MAG: branched-chain amino acid ABC transporter permease [Alphaproteobacteria bacterium]